ncbi:hypothetical protein [Leifsonia sp. WHRI 6310E]|uniref:hypothetical protein n=1 Tax=Leifsonia sp. WHRI 6310E TaxID=3162562 RepID=UPI0032EE00D6
MTIATDLIAAERVRQITEKGWTAEHDAGHATELVYAGASYFEAAEAIRYLPEGEDPAAAAEQMRMQPPLNWPWDAEQWHPSADPVRNLVKAGALIAAAIDSLHTGDLSCQVKATLDRETALAGAPAVCCVCGAPATYRLGMPKPAWCDEHGPHARRAVPEHRPVLVEVTTGSLDDPERRETERVVQERCGCTDDLRHDYGHEKKGPKP